MKKFPEKILYDEQELGQLASELMEFAGSCKILAFYGEMGAGKTTFIRKICNLLGARENVSSPTFSIINEYRDAEGKSIFHFDFYRLESEKEAVEIGCEEYFESGHLCLIEWPEKILNLLPRPHVKILIKAEENKRRFTFLYD